MSEALEIKKPKRLNDPEMKSPEQIAEAALWIAQQDVGTFTGRSVNDDEVRAFMEGRTD